MNWQDLERKFLDGEASPGEIAQLEKQVSAFYWSGLKERRSQIEAAARVAQELRALNAGYAQAGDAIKAGIAEGRRQQDEAKAAQPSMEQKQIGALEARLRLAHAAMRDYRKDLDEAKVKLASMPLPGRPAGLTTEQRISRAVLFVTAMVCACFSGINGAPWWATLIMLAFAWGVL